MRAELELLVCGRAVLSRLLPVPGRPPIKSAGRLLLVPGRPALVPGRPALVLGREALVPGRPALVPGRDAPVPGRDVPVPGRPALVPGRDALVPGRVLSAVVSPAVARRFSLFSKRISSSAMDITVVSILWILSQSELRSGVSPIILCKN